MVSRIFNLAAKKYAIEYCVDSMQKPLHTCGLRFEFILQEIRETSNKFQNIGKIACFEYMMEAKNTS